jgi:hypothetical protein
MAKNDLKNKSSDYSGKHDNWETSEIVDYKLSIINGNALEEFSFLKDGDVRATIGTTDGPVAAPIYYWEIDKNGIMIIKDYDKKSIVKIAKISESNNVISAECERHEVWSKCKYRKEKY